jgi:hypothetical protein
MNRFQGIDSANLCSLAGRYDNSVPTRFLAPIEMFKNSSAYLGNCLSPYLQIRSSLIPSVYLSLILSTSVSL